MSISIITAAPAVLLPRAQSLTFCWYATTTGEDFTVWTPVTHDRSSKYITSYYNFPVWVDSCTESDGRVDWCSTLTVPTDCASGTIWGISSTSDCTGGRSQCLTELMYQRHGDATPKLSKVICDSSGYSTKTYFVEIASTPPVSTPTTTTSTVPALTSSGAAASSTTLTASFLPHTVASTQPVAIPTAISTEPVSTSSGAAATSTTLNASASVSIPLPSQTAASPPAQDKSGPSGGLIAGSVLGGVAVLGIISLTALWIVKRYSRQNKPALNTSQYGSRHPQGGAWTIEVAEHPMYRAELSQPGLTFGRSELDVQGSVVEHR
ncbi:hypothetical protein CC86DRAFT_409796 [Ophiobolus disseminans]|uniref:Mid2 domain-containing protein n=1 Tax=Ophiobolus disseminans TaxID=1469910 RepID=A0A6A6ZRF1_9PLEO|nr:hypothetical protein CC86DRAFT_409796 [Ophiobolus disseminans]